LKPRRSKRTDGQQFLAKLADSSQNAFEIRFASISTRLGLGMVLNGHELVLLHDAALDGTLCCIAFNGLGGCRGEIKPEREIRRMRLERAFMAARDAFYSSAGCKALPLYQMGAIERIFLNVFVTDDNLAA
jgi:hypothetical protein